jgi:hypothetical protein
MSVLRLGLVPPPFAIEQRIADQSRLSVLLCLPVIIIARLFHHLEVGREYSQAQSLGIFSTLEGTQA